MKKLFTLLFVFFLYSAQAANYYFSSVSGDDSRSSTAARNASTPWKTLGKLNSFFSSLLPGDSVLLKRGDTFYGSIIVKKSGTSTAPIVIGAYGSGSKPTITSLVSLTSWTSKGNGIYESSNSALTTKVKVVLMNGVQQELGRYPNSDAANKGYLYFESHSGKTSITDNELSSSINWKGADLVLRPRRWILGRGVVTAHSGTTISYKASTSYEPRDKYGYFFTNSIKTLDKFGEWYYDSTLRKLNVFFGSKDPSSYKVQVPAMDELIHAEKFSYVVLDNLNIKGATASAVNIRYGSHIYITNCDISYSGENAIKLFYHTYLKVEGCTINNSNYGGIYMGYNGADNAIVRNNKISNTSLFAGMAQNGDQAGLGIMSYGNNNLIEYNEIRKTGFNAIAFNGQYVTVKNNYIDSFCMVKDDGAGIYAYNGTSTTVLPGRKIIGNIVLNGIGAAAGAYTPYETPAEGIYMDEGASFVEVKGNTVANCTNQGIYFHNAHDITVSGNTIFTASNRYMSMYQSANKPLIRNNTISGNIFFSTLGTQTLLYLKAEVTTDLKLFGKFSSNYYARPSDANTATVLSKVRVYESTATIKSFTTPIRFEYNATKVAKTIVLDATYVDAKNTQQSGSITLQPYTSIALIRTGAITNTPPSVNITSPVANATYAAPATVTISATATDAGGTISKVDFYNGSTLIGSDNTSPYSFTWNNIAAGSYSITAKATDNGSLVTTSAAVAFSVYASNLAPTVDLVGIQTNIILGSLPSVSMTATAADTDGTIAKVDFYNADTLIGTVTSSPYTLTWNNVPAGIYTITAKATDNNGAVTTSSAQTISVVLPVLALRSINNATLPAQNKLATTTKETNTLGLKVFPNPTVNEIQINLEGIQINQQKASLNIQNLSGVVFKSIPVTGSDKIIKADVSSFTSGMYIVSIVSNNHVISKKFIKN